MNKKDRANLNNDKSKQRKQTNRECNDFANMIIAERKARNILRIVFFAIICTILLVVPISAVIALFLVAQKTDKNVADIGVAITCLASLLGSSLFCIVAKHLFPDNGDQAEINYMLKLKDSEEPKDKPEN